ncbi:uncharacterized protein F5147DRAFT_655499 [Suillus discolor]|uniref:Myb-like domain-containing protein n=1 Tax=Suillus discolor TaxID=1912936 RepID=A0A9P7F064_9AGAM|nr:uncharacterized protein F5147DRAFT_655499 [Suillus discolor]KAG2100713.1 hypothetical protein F5147DRAFT_655499 [Suillus discolor]
MIISLNGGHRGEIYGSQGPIHNKDTLSRSDRTRKAPVHWTHDEEARFLQYLLTHKAQAGDTMSFKKSTFRGAADDIGQVFPNQRGGEKTANVCKTKWTNISTITIIHCQPQLTAFHGVMSLEQELWTHMGTFRRNMSSPTVKPFKTKGFSHFDTINQIMPHGPSTAKGMPPPLYLQLPLQIIP